MCGTYSKKMKFLTFVTNALCKKEVYLMRKTVAGRQGRLIIPAAGTQEKRSDQEAPWWKQKQWDSEGTVTVSQTQQAPLFDSEPFDGYL